MTNLQNMKNNGIFLKRLESGHFKEVEKWNDKELAESRMIELYRKDEHGMIVPYGVGIY